jgi:divalent metal cation (Fe/Co/Zn/Cd) transporter
VVVVVAGCAVCPDVLGIVLGIVFGSVVVVVVLLGAGISVLVKVLGDIVNEESVLLSLIYNNCLYLYIYAIIYLVLFSINLRLIKNMKSIQKL